jgi:hypothetical protein
MVVARRFYEPFFCSVTVFGPKVVLRNRFIAKRFLCDRGVLRNGLFTKRVSRNGFCKTVVWLNGFVSIKVLALCVNV